MMSIPAELVVSGTTSAPEGQAETVAPAGATSKETTISEPSKDGAAPVVTTLTKEEWDKRENALKADLEKAQEFGRRTQSEYERLRQKADPLLEREKKERDARLAMPERYQAIYDEQGPVAAMNAQIEDRLSSERERQEIERAQISQSQSDDEALSKMKAEWSKSGKSEPEFHQFMRDCGNFAGMSYQRALWIVQQEVAGANANRVTMETQEKMARDADTNARRKAAESQVEGKTAMPTPGAKDGAKGPLDGMREAAARMESVSSWD